MSTRIRSVNPEALEDLAIGTNIRDGHRRGKRSSSPSSAGAVAATARPEVEAIEAAPLLNSVPGTLQRSSQFPTFAPLLEELEIAGWSSHRKQLSGNFHDWQLLEDRRVMLMAGFAHSAEGNCLGENVEAALVAQGAWSALRAHAMHVADAGTLLSMTLRSLWSGRLSNLPISVAIAMLDLEGGRANVAVAGDCLALRVRASGVEKIAIRQPALGTADDFTYLAHSVQIAVRERIVIGVDDPGSRPAKWSGRMATAFNRLDAETHRRQAAADVVALVREEHEQWARYGPAWLSVVAVRRR
ncbi:MAG: SpoIIE family protein phosphatase [Pirellulales bacterium]|nr:SpoIIE family protein phosphatase [Pirellulales bacterium]